MIQFLLDFIGGYQICKWLLMGFDAYNQHRKQNAWNHSERDGGWYD